MKSKLVKNNLRVPKFLELNELKKENLVETFTNITQNVGSRFIIKPCQGGGSSATMRINNFADFENYYENHKTYTCVFDIEEYIEGTLYHIDSLVQNDTVIFSKCSEYLYPNMDFLTEGKSLVSMPLPEDMKLVQRLSDFSQKVLMALGLIDGATHMEVFITADAELVFLEVGARPPGGSIYHNYLKQHGINYFNLHAQILSQQSIQTPTLQPKTYVFFGYLAMKAGVVKKLHSLPFVSNHEIDWKIKIGDTIEHSSQNTFEIAAELHVENLDYGTLRQDFEALRSFPGYDVVSSY